MSNRLQRDSVRCFIVGSARSGTTLLQAMLASHSSVFSFPESHFFCEGAPRGRVRGRLRIVVVRVARRAVRNSLRLMGRPDLDHMVPKRSFMFRSYARAFIRAVDRAAADAGKSVWVEKTPHHLDYIPLIKRSVPGAKFVHVLRDGRDVVASQRHAWQQDPEYWGDWSLADLVRQWNDDTSVSLAYEHVDDHLMVSYEALTEEPERVLSAVCDFLGLRFERSMLQHWLATDRILGERRSEPWMTTAFQPLEDRRLKKFRTVFTESEQVGIVEGLSWGGDTTGHVATV